MTVVISVLVTLLVVAVVVAVVVTVLKKRRSEALEGRFGPEYERRVDGSDSRRDAERELTETAARRDRLEIRDLTDEERERYTTRWQQVQTRFVDEPGPAVEQADDLVGEVMQDQGYPVQDFDERAEMAAIDHPDVVEHYRAAHRLHDEVARTGATDSTTEQLREAFVHYRALFEALVGHSDDGVRTTDR